MKGVFMKDTFANRLRIAMKNNNIRAADLSRKTNISKTQISNWLSGKYKAKQDSIYILSKVLNVDEGWLMGFDVPETRKPDDSRKTDLLKEKINNLSSEQKDMIIKIIDNMK